MRLDQFYIEVKTQRFNQRDSIEIVSGRFKQFPYSEWVLTMGLNMLFRTCIRLSVYLSVLIVCLSNGLVYIV